MIACTRCGLATPESIALDGMCAGCIIRSHEKREVGMNAFWGLRVYMDRMWTIRGHLERNEWNAERLAIYRALCNREAISRLPLEMGSDIHTNVAAVLRVLYAANEPTDLLTVIDKLRERSNRNRDFDYLKYLSGILEKPVQDYVS